MRRFCHPVRKQESYSYQVRNLSPFQPEPLPILLKGNLPPPCHSCLSGSGESLLLLNPSLSFLLPSPLPPTVLTPPVHPELLLQSQHWLFSPSVLLPNESEDQRLQVPDRPLSLRL